MTEATKAMSLRDYARVVLHRKWALAVALMATTIPALALSFAQEPIYVAQAQMLLQSRAGESLFGNDFVYAEPDRIVQNEIAVLEGDVVYEQVMTDLGLEDFPPSASGSADEFTDVVTVSVESNDPETAAVLANAYVEAYSNVKRTYVIEGLDLATSKLQEKISDLQVKIDDVDAQLSALEQGASTTLLDAQRRSLIDQQSGFAARLEEIEVDAALVSGSAQLVSPAFPPDEPVAPTTRRNVMLAVVVGLMLGLGAAFLIDYLDDSIRTPEDLQKLQSPVPLLATVPVDPPPDNRPVSISRPDDVAVESYRALRTNVQFLGFERDTQVIEVTSAMSGEGKTTTAVNLAVVMAQTGASVVLVDADLRKPRVHEVFSIAGANGLTNNLVGEPIDMTLIPYDAHLTVLPAGKVPPNPSEMLSGRRMAAVVAELKARFDYVVLDSAPALPVSDAVALSRHVDGVILVVQAGRTSAPQLRHTLANLEQVSAPMLGIVLNRAKQSRGGYGYGYGYGYGTSAAQNDDKVATGV